MAGSFDIFRKYQRSLLVFVAILAMFAFFVLPPILQMGFGGPGGDPVAVTWKGGAIREAELDRAVAMRTVVNRFLAETAMAAGRDPGQLPLFPDSEEQVVQSMMLAKEAAANGLVVSDAAINDFLGQWTNNLVRPDQFRDIIAGLRLGPMGVSQRDVFDTLRSELSARNMFLLFQTGFSGDPPGWRWDYFCRLERQATIEAVPVVVESVADQVAEPSVAELRSFFDRYKDDLPEPRSTDPGFREPHRVKYQYLVAKREAFVDKAKAAVTDAEIAEYYEKNKATMFRERPKPTASPRSLRPSSHLPRSRLRRQARPQLKQKQTRPAARRNQTVRSRLNNRPRRATSRGLLPPGHRFSRLPSSSRPQTHPPETSPLQTRQTGSSLPENHQRTRSPKLRRRPSPPRSRQRNQTPRRKRNRARRHRPRSRSLSRLKM
jgi:hypothetical protein